MANSMNDGGKMYREHMQRNLDEHDNRSGEGVKVPVAQESARIRQWRVFEAAKEQAASVMPSELAKAVCLLFIARQRLLLDDMTDQEKMANRHPLDD
jgi:hypothetical protein